MIEPGRPNHFFPDSLGDPETCTGDHNHPSDLPRERLTDYLRRNGIPYRVRKGTVNRPAALVIRLDRLAEAEGGAWEDREKIET